LLPIRGGRDVARFCLTVFLTILVLQAAFAAELRAAVLHDNGPFVTHHGTGVGGADESWVQTSLGLSAFGFVHRVGSADIIADDFAVPGGWVWTVEQITFLAYQLNAPTAPSSMTSLVFVILDAAPGTAGANVVFGDWTANRLTSSEWTGCYRVEDALSGASDERPIMSLGCALTPPVEIPAGTYWIAWQSEGSLDYGPYAVPVTILGQTTTGNAVVSENAGFTYVPATDNHFQQGFPFIIEGTSIDTPVAPATWGSVKALYR
jgi:hypothetical protein